MATRGPAYLMYGKKPTRSKTAARPANPYAAAGTGWGSSTPFAPGTGWYESPDPATGTWFGGPEDYITDPMVSNPDYNWETPAWQSPTYTADQNVDRTPGAGGQPEWLSIEGYMPDYMANIEGDPEYVAALKAMEMGNLASEAQARQGISQLAIGYGGDLSQLLSAGLIDQATADRARQNEFSTMKELGRALERGTAQGEAGLAARGMTRSGALTTLHSGLQENFQRQSTAATNELLNNVEGVKLGLAQAKADRFGNLTNARSSVANRLMQMAMMQARPATRARWNPDMGAYESPDGRLFDVNGRQI